MGWVGFPEKDHHCRST